jgi:predicted nucleic acid-binding protein
VLLSAVPGGRAKSILEHPSVEAVLTAETTFEEVRKYAAHLATRKRLPLDLVMLTMASLPVEIVGRPVYASQLARAEKRIGKRDPDDVDILALALHFKIPLWSNDHDFEDSGVEWYTTEALLKRLDMVRV